VTGKKTKFVRFCGHFEKKNPGRRGLAMASIRGRKLMAKRAVGTSPGDPDCRDGDDAAGCGAGKDDGAKRVTPTPTNAARPFISVIIAHTRETVRDSLDSLARQTYPADRLEAIVVGTCPAHVDADRYTFAVRYLVCDDPNPSHRRNLGMRNSSADVFAFLDDDAQAAEDWCEAAIGLFNALPDLGVVGGPTFLPEHLGVLHRLTYKLAHAGFFGNGHENLSEDSCDLRKITGYIICCNMFVFPSRLEIDREFDIQIGYGGEDTAFLWSIGKTEKCRIMYSTKVAVFHSRGSFGWSFLRTRFKYRFNNGAMIGAHPHIYFGNKKFLIGVLLGTLLTALFIVYPVTIFTAGGLHLLLSLLYSQRYRTEDWRLVFLFPPALLTMHFVYYVGIVTGLFSVVHPKQLARVRATRRRLR
jgi:glycosyltransferase involved in cell wall biosynthesis